jgi:lysyl-tRNA synthetase class 2
VVETLPAKTARPARSRDSGAGDGWRARVPAVLAGALAVLAVLCAVAAVSAAFYHRTQWVRITVDELLAPAPANLGYAAFVGVLAAGVARRKRVAFWMLMVGFGLNFLSDVALFAVYDLIRTSPSEYWESGLRPYEPWLAAGNLVLTTAIIVVLAVSHRQFYARVQRASLPKALVTLVAALTVSSLVGWGWSRRSTGRCGKAPTSSRTRRRRSPVARSSSMSPAAAGRPAGSTWCSGCSARSACSPRCTCCSARSGRRRR